MTEALLRRWVRGELPPAERRELSRWMVRNTDPRLGAVLHGILAEEAELRADAALARRGGLWPRLVETWSALLDRGLAELAEGASPALILAALPAEAPAAPALRLLERDGALVVALHLPEPAAAALFLTDDEGRVRLLASTDADAGLVVPLPATRGPRATVWAVWGVSLVDPDPAAALAVALDAAGDRVLALRMAEE